VIVTDEDKLRALKLLAKEPSGAYLSYLIRQVRPELQNVNPRDKNYHKVYVKLLRFFRKLQSTNYVSITKRDGMLFIKIADHKLFDLIKASEKFKLSEKKVEDKGFIPKRSNPLRIEAIKTALQVRVLDEYSKDEIKACFEEYIKECKSKMIVLKRREDAPTFYPLFVKLNYKTRFTDKKIKAENLRKYEAIWRKATLKYKKAVFLTLTTDPKRFKSIYHSWRHFGIALNRFISYLTKYFKSRPRYLAVYEFTKSGLLHVHIIIFGYSYLLTKDKITKEWERCGQGTINYVYAIKNDGGKWSWIREKPKEAKSGTDVKTYLAKYLKKALFAEEQLFLYWTSNKRFFSYSRKLIRFKRKEVAKVSFFYFLGAYSITDLPDLLYNYFILGYEEEPLSQQPSNFLRENWLKYTSISYMQNDAW